MSFINKKMSLVECVNTFRLDKVINHYDKLVENNLHIQTICENGEPIKKHNLLPVLNKYYDKIQNKHEELGLVKVDYIPSKFEKVIKPKTSGRLYPKGGLGLVNMPKNIRNYLLHDEKEQPLVIDLDIKNCHPTLYYQWLVKNEYPVDKLRLFKDYIQNRSKWIMEFPDIKSIIITIINGCQEINVDLGSTKLENLIQEIWNTHHWISQKWSIDNLENLKDFIFHEINTQIERKIIDFAMSKARDWSDDEDIVDIYAYDGFAVGNRGRFILNGGEDFVNEINSILTTDGIDGYTCEFDIKPLKIEDRFLEFMNKLDTTEGTDETEAEEKFPTIRLDIPQGQFLGDVLTENIIEDIKEDIIANKMDMGGGKTYKIYKDVQDVRMKRPLTTISVLNRISLIDNIKHDYPFVHSYRETEQTEGNKIDGVNKSVVVCCESLYRLTEETLQNCEILIADEFMSLIPQMLCHDTHRKNLCTNQEILLGLIRNTKKIVILDANISDETIEFVREIRSDGKISPEPQIKKFVCAPTKKRNIHWGPFMTKMMDNLALGHKIFIPCTRSIKFGMGVVQQIQNEFPTKKVVYINSENKGDYVELLSDTSKWGEYDVVMISPCISTGVSCVIRDYFHSVYCFFSPQSCNGLDASQQIGRVRYPITEDVYIEISEGGGNSKYKHYIKNKKDVLRMLYYNIHNLYSMNTGLIDTEFDYDTFKRTIKTTPRTDLFCFNYVEQFKYYRNYKYHLKKSLQNSYICNHIDLMAKNLVDVEEEIRMKKQVKENAKEYENKRCDNIFSSPQITTSEAEQLERINRTDDGLTEAQRHKYLKFLLTKRTCISYDGIERFVKNHSTKEPRTLFKLLDKRAAGVVKKINYYIRHLTEYSNLREHDLVNNQSVLGMMFEADIRFDLRDLNITDNITTEFLESTYKGQLLRYHWVNKILKFFGSEFLFHQVSLTKEEFQECWNRFVDWCGEVCPGFTKLTNFGRISVLFPFEMSVNCEWTLKNLKKTKNQGIGDYTINKILGTIGLGLDKIEVKVREGKKVIQKPSIFQVNLDYPVLLNYYLEPEPTRYNSGNKKFLQLDKDCIPILTVGNIVNYMPPDWMEKYQKSVFYRLPQIQR
jgi:hypothetical protein